MKAPRIIFPHIEGHWDAENTVLQRDLARIMAASCREHMPGVPIFMVTDAKTPAIEGIEPLRFSRDGFGEFIPWLTNACSLVEGPVLYLDSDVVVQHDLRALLNVTSDIVLPWRGMKMVDGKPQPFIFGCVAYRNAEIWKEIRDRVLAMPAVERMWYGSQIAVFEMWMEEQNHRGKWKIASVPRETYNYTPKDENDAPAGVWVLHYKGRKRKAWMLERFGHLLQREAA